MNIGQVVSFYPADGDRLIVKHGVPATAIVAKVDGETVNLCVIAGDGGTHARQGVGPSPSEFGHYVLELPSDEPSPAPTDPAPAKAKAKGKGKA